jgi:hypothetical protein
MRTAGAVAALLLLGAASRLAAAPADRQGCWRRKPCAAAPNRTSGSSNRLAAPAMMEPCVCKRVIIGGSAVSDEGRAGRPPHTHTHTHTHTHQHACVAQTKTNDEKVGRARLGHQQQPTESRPLNPNSKPGSQAPWQDSPPPRSSPTTQAQAAAAAEGGQEEQ